MMLISCILLLTVVSLVGASYIDPLTLQLIKMRQTDGKLLGLVMSDEFNDEGRGFATGEDAMFEAVSRPDDCNACLEYYNSSREYVTTRDGALVITTKAVKTTWYEWKSIPKARPVQFTKNYTSAMLASWNKFCFTGGIVEFSVKLPGNANGGGLWPAVWLMGNLGRAAYEESTMNIWPWSYNKCGEIDHLDAKQEISACNPNPGYGLNAFQGRGAPEIDIFEAMPGHSMPTLTEPMKALMSSSLQLSPGVPWEKRPKNGVPLSSNDTWYEKIFLGNRSDYNYAWWGQPCGLRNGGPETHYMEDAISANTLLERTHFNDYHNYKLEWQPGAKGYLHWYLDDEKIFGIEGSAVNKLTGALIPVEPMYLVMNTAISHVWGMPEPCPKDTCSACYHCYDCTNPDCQCSLPEGLKSCSILPAEMKIDYVRIYQDVTDSSHSLGCSTKAFPSAEFIESHPERYSDWNKALSPKEVRTFFIIEYILLALGGVVVCFLLARCIRSAWNYCCGGSTRRIEYTPIV